MMKSLLVSLAFLFTLPALLQAQNLTVRGSLVSDEGETVPFAAIGWMDAADSSLVRSTISDDEGRFKVVGLSPGTYYAEISSVGLKPFQSKIITLRDESLELEPFVMTSETAMLDELEITAKKPLIEVQADKTVLNVQDNIAAAGTSGFELLRKAPGVVVDNNDNLIVEGKSGVQIFIDGKPSVLQGEDLTNFLRTLQASDIEAVEVITQPSSKYDAAGTAGIINIKLKKNKNFGTNGSASLGYAYGKNSRYNGSVSLNNRSKKLNLFGTYSTRMGKSERFINLYREQSGLVFDSRSETLSDRQNHNIRAGADWFASPKSTFGVLVSGNLSDADNLSENRTPILMQGNDTPEEVLLAQSDIASDVSNLSANINYRFEDTLGHSFNVDLDYGRYGNDRDNFQPNYYYNGAETVIENQILTRMETLTEIDIMSAKVDYEQNLLGGKLGLGIKSVRIETDNDFDFLDINSEGTETLNLDRSNRFVYEETVHAAYVNYKRRWKKWSMQAGLRVEQTVSDGQLFSATDNDNERVQRNYTNLFPSGGVTFKPSRKHSLALTYSRRIQRPNYQTLNPFEFQINELSFRRGNPFLQPQYTHNVKLAHTFAYTLNTSVSYSYVQDFSAQITEPQGERQSLIQTQNIANQQVWSASISSPFSLTDWWEGYVSLTGNHNTFNVENERFVPITRATLNMYAQNTFSLPEGIDLEVSGWFNSPSVWGGTYLIESMGSLNLAIQKKFLDDQLSARLSVNDVFFTAPWSGETQYTDIQIRGNGGWESRQVRLNLSYRFGNKNVKKARRRQTGIEDESKRAG